MNKEIACKMEKYFLQEFYEKFPGSPTAGTAEHFNPLWVSYMNLVTRVDWVLLNKDENKFFFNSLDEFIFM